MKTEEPIEEQIAKRFVYAFVMGFGIPILCWISGFVMGILFSLRQVVK